MPHILKHPEPESRILKTAASRDQIIQGHILGQDEFARRPDITLDSHKTISRRQTQDVDPVIGFQQGATLLGQGIKFRINRNHDGPAAPPGIGARNNRLDIFRSRLNTARHHQQIFQRQLLGHRVLTRLGHQPADRHLQSLTHFSRRIDSNNVLFLQGLVGRRLVFQKIPQIEGDDLLAHFPGHPPEDMSGIHERRLAEPFVLKTAPGEDQVIKRHVARQHKSAWFLDMTLHRYMRILAGHAIKGLNDDLIHFTQRQILLRRAGKREIALRVAFIEITEADHHQFF